MKLYIPSAEEENAALARTTHMTIAAHQDDIELTSLAVIGHCQETAGEYFTGVVVTDGSSSPRTGAYAGVTDTEMVVLRAQEQQEAARIGQYNALAMMGYTSTQIKDAKNSTPREELADLLRRCRPEVLYTHNPADRHDTHVAVMRRTLEAVRSLPKEERPKKLIGCEVWRSLDWLPEGRKIMLDTGRYIALSKALLGVFKSQIAGGKQYDAAFEGRQRANATFAESHSCDEYECASLALDMTRLLIDDSLTVEAFMQEILDEFKAEVTARLVR